MLVSIIIGIISLVVLGSGGYFVYSTMKAKKESETNLSQQISNLQLKLQQTEEETAEELAKIEEDKKKAEEELAKIEEEQRKALELAQSESARCVAYYEYTKNQFALNFNIFTAQRLRIISTKASNEIKQIILDFFEKIKGRLCDCMAQYLEFKYNEAKEVTTEEGASYISPESRWFKAKDNQRTDYPDAIRCVLGKITWNEFNPFTDYICNSLTNPSIVDHLKALLGIKHRPLIPEVVVREDLKKICNCIISFIKSEYSTPLEMFNEYFAMMQSRNQQIILNKLTFIVNKAVEKCIKTSQVCQNASLLNNYLNQISKIPLTIKYTNVPGTGGSTMTQAGYRPFDGEELNKLRFAHKNICNLTEENLMKYYKNNNLLFNALS